MNDRGKLSDKRSLVARDGVTLQLLRDGNAASCNKHTTAGFIIEEVQQGSHEDVQGWQHVGPQFNIF